MIDVAPAKVTELHLVISTEDIYLYRLRGLTTFEEWLE